MKKTLLILSLQLSLSFFASAQDIKGNYAIKNVQTGMLLRVKDAGSKNGTPLVAYYPENWKCMTWNFKNTSGNSYQLQNLLTNKTFQPVTKADINVAFEEQPLVDASPNQEYEFIGVKKDTYLIKLKGTDLYLTPADIKGKVNSAIILAAKRTTPEQLWTIYEQSPTM
ncbi:RICIN domain-containing protein [Mucilaginibacter ginsenosidivorax]|uniref:RICIN domain-containing protein n=1 Tax=Mucilaginibacter ginsenosidivorax TaxID=862126 RepID=A0A5B8W7V9_9SPHI|nr:RICIN domain-containing protein [Mucilaginibacter ginsenosidivorax]QEC79843.1 RICIN domain-containing protein [Mucilaginibacter ginsenosidivorax]